MQLQIEHLEPYLTYGLKAKMLNHKIDYVGKEVDEIKGFYYLLDSSKTKLWHCEMVAGSRPSINCIKPFLQPIENLTKEIEHNGEKFVPIEKLFEIQHPRHKNKKYYHIVYYNYATCSHTGTAVHCRVLIESIINDNAYWMMKKLFEWHFDVSGLIPQGLAIDINTLKPQK